MINKEQPLESQARKKYYECYAKIVLEELWPEEFIDLQLEEKPDLQSNDEKYGVEVTIAIDEKQLEAESLYTCISYNRVRNEEYSLKKINKNGCKLVNGILAGRSGTDSFQLILILKAFNDKLNKLNGKEYRSFR